MNRKMNEESLYEALYASNGDAMLIESAEDAKTIAEMNDGCTLIEVLPEDEDFADVCGRLDLSAENEPKRVYKIINGTQDTVTGYVAFKEDWTAN